VQTRVYATRVIPRAEASVTAGVLPSEPRERSVGLDRGVTPLPLAHRAPPLCPHASHHLPGLRPLLCGRRGEGGANASRTQSPPGSFHSAGRDQAVEWMRTLAIFSPAGALALPPFFLAPMLIWCLRDASSPVQCAAAGASAPTTPVSGAQGGGCEEAGERRSDLVKGLERTNAFSFDLI
jgi:hypothetical protein